MESLFEEPKAHETFSLSLQAVEVAVSRSSGYRLTALLYADIRNEPRGANAALTIKPVIRKKEEFLKA